MGRVEKCVLLVGIGVSLLAAALYVVFVVQECQMCE